MSTTQEVVTPAEGATEIVRRSLKQPTTPQEQIHLQRTWLGVHEGDLVELRTIEPEVRAITRATDKVVELASDLRMVGKYGRIESFTPQGVYLYPNAPVSSMAASSELDVWLTAGSVKISTTKERIAFRRMCYFDFDPERDGGISVSATGPELTRTLRGAFGHLEELVGVVGADPLLYMMSGNGVQVWLRLADIPESPKLERLVHRMLKYAKAAWSCADYTIDDGVFEANRLAPLAGTVKRKGANYCPTDLPQNEHRPHRMVRVVPVGSPTPTGLTFERLVALSDYFKSKLSAEQAKQIDAEIDKGSKVKGTTGAAKATTSNTTAANEHRELEAANALPTLDVMRALGLVQGDSLVCPKCKGTEDNNVTPMGGFKCHRTSHCTAPFMSNMKLVAFHEFGADDLKSGVFRKSYTWLRDKFPQLPALPTTNTTTPMSGPGMSVDDADATVEPVATVTTGETSSYHYSDTGNGRRLVDQFGDVLRYCPEVGMWLAWTGSYWAWDTCSLLVQEKIKLVVAAIHAEAATLDDPDNRKALRSHAMKSESTRSIEAAMKNARSDPRVRVGLTDLDRNDDLVNFANGTFDLGSCDLRDHDPKDMLTTLLAFDYRADAKCPKFRALLERAKPDSEEQAFRIRRLGQYLSGKPDKSFIISWGPKDTAKSTYYQTVAAVLGPYASRVPRSVIEKSFHEQHPAQLMTMKGKRLCFGAEIRETIDIDRIKELTGESDIPARGMGENWITIRRTWKLEIYSNDKPRIDFTTDDGMATRTIFDPWLVQIPRDEQIPNYHEVLAAEEAEGILALMVEGWKDYKRVGLAPPKSILAATERFLDEQGGFMEWMAECCDTSEVDAETPTDDLFESYRRWFEQTIGRKLPAKMTKQVFGMRFGKKYPSGQRSNIKVRRGIKLNGRNVPEYDLNEPYIEAPGMVVMDIFYEREIETLMSEGNREAA